MRRAGICLLAGVALLSACSSQAAQKPPTWEPSPPFGANGEVPGATPIVPVPTPHGQPGGKTPSPGKSSSPGGPNSSPPPSGKQNKKIDPNVVATHLTSPVGLSLLPDGTALVGERTTGRIVRVQPRAGQPVPTVRTIHGLDTKGDGGLLDLAVSPDYAEDGLIYAYVTTPKDDRVIDFTLRGPATPVLVGIPKGRTGNTGRLLFARDGTLYVGTGDGGHPARAENPDSLGGKVLRISDIGRPAKGNPTPGSPVYTRGHHDVDGLCAVPHTSSIIEVEDGTSSSADEINVLGAGHDYGWPATSGVGLAPAARLGLPYTAPGGCAVEAGQLWVTSLTGRALLSAPLKGAGAQLGIGAFTPGLKNKYGRLRTVVAAPDGALWLTTSNKDGHGNPVPADERVIRYVPSGANNGGGKTA